MATLVDVGSIASYFEALPDPRHPRHHKHLVGDIAVIAVAAILCHCDGPTAIHQWATLRKDGLAEYLPLPNGIPSRDCIRRLLVALQLDAFQPCFREWVAAACPAAADAPRRLVAIDGKTCRGSRDPAAGLGPLHLVRARASEEGIALGRVAADDKSNEITAIPRLLDRIALENTVVTIDAAGCQKEVVARIVAGGGDAVIAVKANQPELLAAIESFFRDVIERDFADLQYRSHETRDEGHGRTDDRAYSLAKVPRDFAPAKDWPGVKAIGYAVRRTTADDGRESCEVRYYLSTRHLSGKRFAEAVRRHWAIEARHGVLDVTFREDDRRTRERTLGNNLSWLRRFAVTLLKRHPVKDSIRGKMLRCGYSTDFLAEVLEIQGV